MINQTKFHQHKQPDYSNVLSNIYAKHLRSTLAKKKTKNCNSNAIRGKKAETSNRCGRKKQVTDVEDWKFQKFKLDYQQAIYFYIKQ